MSDNTQKYALFTTPKDHQVLTIPCFEDALVSDPMNRESVACCHFSFSKLYSNAKACGALLEIRKIASYLDSLKLINQITKAAGCLLSLGDSVYFPVCHEKIASEMNLEIAIKHNESFLTLSDFQYYAFRLDEKMQNYETYKTILKSLTQDKTLSDLIDQNFHFSRFVDIESSADLWRCLDIGMSEPEVFDVWHRRLSSDQDYFKKCHTLMASENVQCSIPHFYQNQTLGMFDDCYTIMTYHPQIESLVYPSLIDQENKKAKKSNEASMALSSNVSEGLGIFLSIESAQRMSQSVKESSPVTVFVAHHKKGILTELILGESDDQSQFLLDSKKTKERNQLCEQLNIDIEKHRLYLEVDHTCVNQITSGSQKYKI